MVQLFGGLWIKVGSVAERLHREIRPSRMYEGASVVHGLFIARPALAAGDRRGAANV